mmetsp:Transcript_19568/g.29160  ORF Transcript_19568/g.29160 Transcript_19568/m.29160 type:complete len:204 (-) Transcript_19568:670-1281(-)
MQTHQLTTSLNLRAEQGKFEHFWVNTKLFGSSCHFIRRVAETTFTWTILETDVTQMQNGRDDVENLRLLIWRDTTHIHGNLGVRKLCDVIERIHLVTVGLTQIRIVLRCLEVVLFLLVGICTCQQLVENVECALVLTTGDHTRFFQQVDAHRRTRQKTTSVELEFDEFTETRRVVVTHCFGITESLQYRIQLDQLFLKFANTT